ncbi:MAG: hypothetical protein L3K03_07530 [Thermoplasmata archaeon]|nr:hypothetical protein [Thermoplasmata archaeon]
MSDPARQRGPAARRFVLAGLVVLTLLVSGLSVPVVSAAATVPPLPRATGGELVTTLSLPASSPGGSSTLSITLLDPFLYAMTNLSLTFGWYSFNPYPGTGAGSLPGDGPTFQNSASESGLASAHDAYLPAGIAWAATVSVVVPAAAPLGTYSVRDNLTFDLSGVEYQLASRGYFSNVTWQRATILPDGGPTLNLTVLNVSGVLPETALFVQQTSTVALGLDVILGAALLAVGAGAYVAFRRGSGSSSGARSAPEPSQPRNALGTKRSNDGD